MPRASLVPWAILLAQEACDTGLSRESLYKALGETGNLSFSTVLKVWGILLVGATAP